MNLTLAEIATVAGALAVIFGLYFLIQSKVKASTKATAQEAITEAAKNGKETAGAASHIDREIKQLKSESQQELREDRVEIRKEIAALRLEMATLIAALRLELVNGLASTVTAINAVDSRLQQLGQNFLKAVQDKKDY